MLEKNSYPGRGIIIGRTPENSHAVVAYFIMGRSENSRNRVFEETEDGIRTRAFDEAKVTDPSLIIYHPVRKSGAALIVTNGDQTDTVRDFLEGGQSFEAALRTREFEPDAPNWTPRISGLLAQDGSYRLSILKSADGAGTACLRQFFEYPGERGIGHYIHTYACDGNPIPSFAGEPERVSICGDIDSMTDELWRDLDEENRVSLYVRFQNLSTGEYSLRIINKNR